jgi:hypothetical protein
MATESSKYNGWANYETWCVNLWMDNEYPNYWPDRAQELWEECEEPRTKVWTQSECARFQLADEMKEWFADNNPLADQANVYSDMLNAAFSEVNWSEIANAQFCDVEGYEGEQD